MAGPDDEVHIDDVSASGGSKENVGRWVLIIGTLVAIVLLSATWIIGAWTQGDVEEEATVSGQIASEEDDAGVGMSDNVFDDEGGEIDAEADQADQPLDVVPNE